MNFTKMHGTGNDFIVLDGRDGDREWSAISQAMCDRHYGIGADGIVVVLSSNAADLKMRMFNPDGSEAEMCGNGIRCCAKYVVDHGLSGGRVQFSIETMAGIHHVTFKSSEGGMEAVRVGMGRPRYRPQDVPVAEEGPGPLVDYPLALEGKTILVTCLSIGNPHAVAFLDDPVEDWPLARLGPLVEHHQFFPHRTNFEIVNVMDHGHLTARVWERGAGLTLSCGSGACAIAVAAWMRGRIGGRVEISLPGGILHVDWDGSGEIWLEGPVQAVFEGRWPDVHGARGGSRVLRGP